MAIMIPEFSNETTLRKLSESGGALLFDAVGLLTVTLAGIPRSERLMTLLGWAAATTEPGNLISYDAWVAGGTGPWGWIDTSGQAAANTFVAGNLTSAATLSGATLTLAGGDFVAGDLTSGATLSNAALILAGGSFVVGDLTSATTLTNAVLTEQNDSIFVAGNLTSSSTFNNAELILAGGDFIAGSFTSSSTVGNAVLALAGGDFVAGNLTSTSTFTNAVLEQVVEETIIYSNVGDEYIGRADIDTFAGVRSSGDGNTGSRTGTTIHMAVEGYEEDTDEYRYVSRGFVDFTIPAGANFTTASLTLQVAVVVGTPVISAQLSSHDASQFLNADYDNFALAPNGTSLGQTATITGTGTYTISGALLLTQVNALRVAGGTLKLVLREYAHDFQNSDLGLDLIAAEVYSSEYGTQAHRPKLVLQ